MIASVRGVVLEISLNHAVIDVGGIGLAVSATPATIALLRVGETAKLSTTFVVRAEAMTLFGFADVEEREVFETVQTVSGIGPRTALAMLAVLTPEALRVAIAEENLTTLMRVPGIGRKGAARLVLELADKLGPPRGAQPAGAVVAGKDHSASVVEALEGLGWSAKAAQDAVDAVVAVREANGATFAPDDVPEVLRAALRSLGGARRG